MIPVRSGALPERVRIRLLNESDSIAELTELLHRAYKRLGDMGLNFTAVDQSEEVTRNRIGDGECYLAILDRQMVGTATLHIVKQPWYDSWYGREGVAIFNQFAVEPHLQKVGIGRLLMDHLEQRARQAGATELALDTAEPAQHLIEYYTRRGYRFIEYRQWEGKTYRSVVLSKTLTK